MSPVPRPEPRPVSLDRVIAVVSGTVVRVVPAVGVIGVTLDSRAVQPGDIYAALPGHNTHGARFAADAVAAGAVAVLTDAEGSDLMGDTDVAVIVVADPRAVLGELAAEVYGQPARSLQMIGVTGTNGKTTVTAMIAAGLTAADVSVGTIGTVGVRIGDETLPGVRTTPEAPDLQATLALMRDRGVQTVVMEVSSIALAEHRVDGIRYDIAAFTNLSQDHLDYHGTMEAYFDAKRLLFSKAFARQAVIGIDDEWGDALTRSCDVPFVTWSLFDQHADYHAMRESSGVVIAGPGGHQPVDIGMAGSFNVANAVCAFAVLSLAGIDASAAAAGVGAARVAGRMQVVSSSSPRADGVTGIVDYAHTPDAIERVLRAVRDSYAARIITVVGAGGDRDRSKRAAMGTVAARLSDVVVVTDDNPRSEEPASIRAEVLEGTGHVAPGERAEVLEVPDRLEAVTVAVDRARPGDVVVVLGKGHEQGQEVAGVITPFDDARALRSALDLTAGNGGAG